ncbi:hypothetical protein KVV02_006388 [Mortierella alpina]|uniref:Galactose oxidase n=1 Tax=Mortierella alpina TaxID=64518 RepID=A0A9P8D3F6_MORAP|nr:hypothetical protein KVV02_006388 [Mortierella alpina]
MKAAFVLTAVLSIACAQPQSEPARTTRAITLVENDLYVYGEAAAERDTLSILHLVLGSGAGGTCYSDLYTLHLDASDGWTAGTAPWKTVSSDRSTPLGSNSWAVASADGEEILFYGQSLCPQQLTLEASSPHPFKASSGSVIFERDDGKWSQSDTASDIFGPRLVKSDEPVPVQVVDQKNRVVYTFVYDAFNPQLGTQLWTFSTDHLPSDIAKSAKNTTMTTTQPPAPPPVTPPPTNSTNATLPAPPPPPTQAPVVLAPFVDIGAAVYLDGTIVVIGGGRASGEKLVGDEVDAGSGYYKMDRCWIYTIASNQWRVQNLTAAGGDLPLPRRLAALLVVGTKIYMHGGNTTRTDSTDQYAKDLWILDTATWQWTSGPSSPMGRASHTLIRHNNTLLSLSGFDFETTKAKAAKNSFVMVYDLDATTWGSQFGQVNQSFFQQHSIAIIGGAVAGFVLFLLLASIASRLWRKHTHKRSGLGELKRRNRSSKAFLSAAATGPQVAGAAISKTRGSCLSSDVRFSGQASNDRDVNYGPQSGHETHIDLSTLTPQPDQQQYNPYASVHHQQQVPLMNANALEQQEVNLEPYVDDDESAIRNPIPQHPIEPSHRSDHTTPRR